MKYLKLLLGSLFSAVLLTMLSATGSLLWVMASNREIGTRVEGFFGAVYFQTITVDGNTFTMNFGISSAWPLLISVLVLTAFLLLLLLILSFLKSYRASLFDDK